MKHTFTFLILLSLASLTIFSVIQQPRAQSVSSIDDAADKAASVEASIDEEKKSDEPERVTHPFDRAWLEEKAKTLSKTSYELPTIPVDDPLSQMSYDDYKKIQFRRAATIWSKEERQFRLNPLHPGFLFKTPVNLNLVVGGTSRRILYTSEIFAYDKEQEAVKESDAKGYSGFSVTTPINNEKKWDEFLVFQGGTYFRAVGQSNWYGLSARGLAINTGKPNGEEFPVFTDFWIERPAPNSSALVVHALMQSKSATGAYTFTATPGENTEIVVDSTIYPRQEIRAFGIAPLTSMFLFNPVNRSRFDDFRPSVHDSDGLAIIKGNSERLWRPLANPSRLQVSVFSDENIKGFGLMQRSREFSQFEDIEAHYQDRPSAWVTPIGNWGAGHVELLEIPTQQEIHDNIVAFWQPKEVLQAGGEYPFSFKLSFGSSPDTTSNEGKITSSSSGKTLGSDSERDFVIDFSGKEIPQDLTINATSSTGAITGVISKVVPQNGKLRVVVKFQPGDEDLAELRVSLANGDTQWGETWLYRWTR